MARAWDERADELAAAAIAAGEPTAWFDRLYGEGVSGTVSMPWDRTEPQAQLRRWAQEQDLRGDGARALVVGCGLGADAEFVAGLGFATTAFDIAPHAVSTARERHAGGPVEYRVADLLQPPVEWTGAFDLVVEIFTLQAMPDPPRRAAIPSVTGFVAPGGRLFVVAFRTTGEDDATSGPPFALSERTLRSLAGDRLVVESLEAATPSLWQAVLRAPTAA